MQSDGVTQLLGAAQQGDPQAPERLLPLVYAELRMLASQRMAREPGEHTLQPTALVHEAYLRLIGSGSGKNWDNRGHFFAAAAEAMRRILVDEARRKQTTKHGGGLARRELTGDLVSIESGDSEVLLALDDALHKLAAQSPELAGLVKLRFFAGLDVEQTAEALGVSPRTVKRNWSYARAWLRREMDRE